jgi:hypothetical protein
MQKDAALSFALPLVYSLHDKLVVLSPCTAAWHCNAMCMQVLNLAGNRLRAIPSDVGWLGLKQLNISDNPDLNIPAHVLQCGFKYASICGWMDVHVPHDTLPVDPACSTLLQQSALPDVDVHAFNVHTPVDQTSRAAPGISVLPTLHC